MTIPIDPTDDAARGPDYHGPDEYPLGAIPSPADPRDYPVSQFYAAAGLEALAVPPASAMVSPIPATSNQGTSPMCVAHSEAYEKLHQDLIDQGLFAPDRSAFFYAIGGGPGGAVGRNGLARLVNHGYDVVGGSVAGAAAHKLAAYYSVPVSRSDVELAIATFGGVLFGVNWPHSWFHPVNGILPAPDYSAGGHFIYAIGYDSGGVWVLNSWGTAWGVNGGRAKIPWAYLGRVFEAWKATDVLEWVKRTAACGGGYYRTGPSVGYRSVGSIHAGEVALSKAGASSPGGKWSLTCGTAKTGTGWYAIRAINGVSVQTKFGVPLVYAADGWY